MQSTTTLTKHMDGLAFDLVSAYAHAGAHGRNASGHDPGPAILASVALQESDAVALRESDAVASEAHNATARWIGEIPSEFNAAGAYGGLGGFHAGLRAAMGIYPSLTPLHSALADRTKRYLDTSAWQTSGVAWRDYDLFTGPAGLVLAGIANVDDAELIEPAVAHLALLCDSPGLERLRAGNDIDPRSAFNVGRINTGLGHGVTGVVAALRHAVEYLPDGERYSQALWNACEWLAREVFVDNVGLVTWAPVGREGAEPPRGFYRRQAWCYGTPGIAWTLWDAARVLGDNTLRDLACEAIASYMRCFHEVRYFDDDDVGAALSLCHGAAGILAVVDAFIRTAGLTELEELRTELMQLIASQRADIAELAENDMTILGGAAGIAAIWITARGGSRAWLPLIALR